MNLINAQVRHRQYGTGFIIEQTETQIAVQFAAPFITKKFLFPSSFELYLTFCDSSLQSAVTTLVQAMREQKTLEKKRQEEAIERLREEKRLVLLAQKRTSAKKPSLQSKRVTSKKGNIKRQVATDVTDDGANE